MLHDESAGVGTGVAAGPQTPSPKLPFPPPPTGTTASAVPTGGSSGGSKRLSAGSSTSGLSDPRRKTPQQNEAGRRASSSSQLASPPAAAVPQPKPTKSPRPAEAERAAALGLQKSLENLDLLIGAQRAVTPDGEGDSFDISTLTEDLPALDMDSVFSDSPEFKLAMAAWTQRVQDMGASVSQVASNIRTVYESGTAHRDGLSTFAQSLHDAAKLFSIDDEQIGDPLSQFGNGLSNVQHYFDMFLTQTDYLTRGPVEEMALKYADASELYEEVNRASEKYYSAMSKFASVAAEQQGSVKEDFTRRGQKMFAARQKAHMLQGEYVARLKHLTSVTKISFLQKVLEQMLAQYSFFNYSFQVLSDLEPYMAKLFNCLTDLKASVEASAAEERTRLGRFEADVVCLHDEDVRLLPTDPEKSQGFGANLKRMGKNFGPLSRSRSPRTRRKGRPTISGPTPITLSEQNPLPGSPPLTPLDMANEADAEPEPISDRLFVPRTKRGHMFRRYKKTWKLEYFAVQKDLLISIDDAGFTTEVANLLLCTVRMCSPGSIDRYNCFELISPGGSVCLQALGPRELEEWSAALQAGIADALESGNADGRDDQVILDPVKELSMVAGNTVCADCDCTEIEWASINLGILLCIDCSGAHRSLGVHISKVRSITLDRWTAETLGYMKSIGNAASNAKLEARLGELKDIITKPTTSSPKKERNEYIRLKYAELKFAAPGTVLPSATSLPSMESASIAVAEPLASPAADEEAAEPAQQKPIKSVLPKLAVERPSNEELFQKLQRGSGDKASPPPSNLATSSQSAGCESETEGLDSDTEMGADGEGINAKLHRGRGVRRKLSTTRRRQHQDDDKQGAGAPAAGRLSEVDDERDQSDDALSPSPELGGGAERSSTAQSRTNAPQSRGSDLRLWSQGSSDSLEQALYNAAAGVSSDLSASCTSSQLRGKKSSVISMTTTTARPRSSSNSSASRQFPGIPRPWSRSRSCSPTAVGRETMLDENADSVMSPVSLTAAARIVRASKSELDSPTGDAPDNLVSMTKDMPMSARASTGDAISSSSSSSNNNNNTGSGANSSSRLSSGDNSTTAKMSLSSPSATSASSASGAQPKKRGSLSPLAISVTNTNSLLAPSPTSASNTSSLISPLPLTPLDGGNPQFEELDEEPYFERKVRKSLSRVPDHMKQNLPSKAEQAAAVLSHLSSRAQGQGSGSSTSTSPSRHSRNSSAGSTSASASPGRPVDFNRLPDAIPTRFDLNSSEHSESESEEMPPSYARPGARLTSRRGSSQEAQAAILAASRAVALTTETLADSSIV